MDFMLQMGEFTQKIAYVVPSPPLNDDSEDDNDVAGGAAVEEDPDEMVDLDACIEGLQWMGFNSEEVTIYKYG